MGLSAPMLPRLPAAPARRAQHALRLDIALAGVGTVLTGLLVFWVGASPDLFFAKLPFFIAALLVVLTAATMTGVGWIGILLEPPVVLLNALIVIAYCMTDFSIRKGGVDPGGFDIQSIAKGAIWCVVLLFGAAHGARATWRDRGLLLFLFYALFAFASAFYSPSIGLGLGSGVALLGLAFYAGLMSGWTFERISTTWRNLFIALSLMALLSVIFYFALPEWARDYRAAGAGRLRGLTGSGNSLGPLVAIAAIIGLYCWRTAHTRWARVIIFLAMLVDLAALGLTQSRSSMIALGAAISIGWWLTGRPWRWLVLAIFASIGIWIAQQESLVNALLQLVTSVVSRDGNVAEITSMTGRSEIWDAATAIWLRSPWIGFGLGSPRVVISEAPISRWQMYESAHNWLLESLVSFGVVGSLLLGAFLLRLFITTYSLNQRAARLPAAQRRPEHWLSFCLMRCLVFALINGITEKAFAGMPSPATVMLAILSATAVVLYRRHGPDQTELPQASRLQPQGIGRDAARA